MPDNMDCIVLDDDNGSAVEPMDIEKDPLETNENEIRKKPTNTFEKRLIKEVRKHRVLYDHTHKNFSDINKKQIVWQEIANKLKSDADTCKNIWIELRYKYQCYVRRLRKHYITNAEKSKRRPSMSLESELIYLFRFIDSRKCCSIPFDIREPEKEIESSAEATATPAANQSMNADDDLIIVEQPVELIVIDEDDDSKHPDKEFKVTNEMRVLIAQIKKYPELYDSSRKDFNDYSRKSYLWNAIAIAIGDKATKLMKCWILIITRYEWEISRNQKTTDVAKFQTELQKELEFFEPYILANPDTVYKHSFYLKKTWCEPIDYFKEIYNLIVRMKKLPDVVFVTDYLLNNAEKTKQYFTLWGDISKMKGNAPGECEATWLVMRYFYWELMNMRKQNYQLTDKWYFETIITELYELSKHSPAARLATAQKQTIDIQNKENGSGKSKFNYLNKTNGNSTAPAQNLISTTTTTTNSPANQKQQQQQSQLRATPGPLPKITSAVSLAPQGQPPTGGSGSLQIRQVPCPNVVISPPQPPAVLNQSLITPSASQTATPQTIQLPFALPTQTQLSAVTRPGIGTVAHNTQPLSTPTTMATINRVGNATKVDLSPMVCINTAILSSSGAINTTTSLSTASTPPQTNTVPIVEKQIASTTITSHSIDQKVPVATPALPKISGAVSLLNPNEILIELIASQNGNHLVVHGPPLSEKYQLSMETVAKFIREVMAIPLLHNKSHNQPNLINSYWDHISNKFKLPAHICKACWNFLVENFNHFPQIAPLKELMKPFVTSLNVWTISYNLFNGFDKNAVTNGWLKYMSRLPEVVECIGTYPILFKDVKKNYKDTATSSDMEALCVWRTIGLRFPNINDISTIWTALKNVFCQYMTDIEMGIENKWHINWWRVLAKMKFLVEAKYSKNEPYFYIISNKMAEEIERCAMIEMKNRYGKEDADKVDQKPSTSKNYSSNVQFDAIPKETIEMVTLLTTIEKYPHVYEKADCIQKLEAWKNVAKDLNMDVSDCMLEFRRACRRYCVFKRQDSLSRCQLNQKYYKRFDNIFRNVKTANRRKLNIKTPSELNIAVDDDNSANSTTDFVFPERYISDINMSHCPSDLAVKNWIYALGNLTPAMSDLVHNKLKAILKKQVPTTKLKMK
ncbi:hybrid male rescue isoform X1 [Haematobia irritans]|uniref:hybrid male rescue isoform X1 n=2 Tax=Haematobia irritans TaxID=7368 RepID=UPI003F4FAA26